MSYHKMGATLLTGFALAVCAVIIFWWLAEEVFEGDTKYFDERVRAIINQRSSPTLTAAMHLVTYCGSTVVITALSICALLVFFYLLKWRHDALLLLITMAGALILNGVLKLVFHRARPVPFFQIVAPHSYSFPSGHALHSLCLFGTLAAITTYHVKKTALRVIIWATALTLIVLIGFSRIYLGVHYPSDVLAGYIAAFIWVIAVAFGDHLLRQTKHRTSK